MWTPTKALDMKKKEREIISLFSKLSMKKRNRVSDVLNDMIDRDDEVPEITKIDIENVLDKSLEYNIDEDGTRGDCDPNPRVTKKQLDRELQEYMDSDPRY